MHLPWAYACLHGFVSSGGPSTVGQPAAKLLGWFVYRRDVVSETRKAALAAFDKTPEEKERRAAEQRAQQERGSQQANFEAKKQAMLDRARAALWTIGVDAGDWAQVALWPTFAVLRDLTDDSNYYLTLTVILLNNASCEIRYTPYATYGDDNYQGRDWQSGPIVTDLVSLGRAIREFEAREMAISKSMPADLP